VAYEVTPPEKVWSAAVAVIRKVVDPAWVKPGFTIDNVAEAYATCRLMGAVELGKWRVWLEGCDMVDKPPGVAWAYTETWLKQLGEL